MESAAALRPFQDAISSRSHLKSLLERPGMIAMSNAAFGNLNKLSVYDGKCISSRDRRGALHMACMKTSEATVTAVKGDRNGAVLSDNKQNVLSGKKPAARATFPSGFEDLISEVCEDTKIAELKLKIGAFEINMKRNIDGPAVPAPVVSQTPVMSVTSKPANESTASVVDPPAKSSAEKVNPFENVDFTKEAKLAALEASGVSGHLLISSPFVGTFYRGSARRQRKIACKEGDMIKEGRVVGFVDQCGKEYPVRANVAGEVLKFLYTDGEAIGYGDPVVAVYPSFHDIGVM